MLREFVASSPGDPFPRYGLAMEYKNTGQLAEAEREFADLATRFPDYVPAYLHAGGVQLALGKREAAADTFRAGIAACGRKRPPDGHALGELTAALESLDTNARLEED